MGGGKSYDTRTFTSAAVYGRPINDLNRNFLLSSFDKYFSFNFIVLLTLLTKMGQTSLLFLWLSCRGRNYEGYKT